MHNRCEFAEDRKAQGSPTELLSVGEMRGLKSTEDTEVPLKATKGNKYLRSNRSEFVEGKYHTITKS